MALPSSHGQMFSQETMFDQYWYARPPPDVVQIRGSGNSSNSAGGVASAAVAANRLASLVRKTDAAGATATTTTAAAAAPQQQEQQSFPQSSSVLMVSGSEDTRAISTLKSQLDDARRQAETIKTQLAQQEKLKAAAEDKVKQVDADKIKQITVAEEAGKRAMAGQDRLKMLFNETERRSALEREAYETTNALLVAALNGIMLQAVAESEAATKARERTEVLLFELKAQLERSGAVLKQHATTIGSLSLELVQAKQQTATIAAGYQKLDSKHREVSSALDSHRTQLSEISQKYSQVRSCVDTAETLKGEASRWERAAKDSANEIAVLKQQLADKSDEARALRVELEKARQRAREVLGGGSDYNKNNDNNQQQQGASAAGLAFDALRKEYMDEKRRVERDTQKWKSATAAANSSMAMMASSTPPAAVGGGGGASNIFNMSPGALFH
eukprot:PhM_4_TR10055/c0_g1_i1/m.42490